MRTEFLCISVLRVASGPRVKLAGCKSALTTPHPVVYSTDRSEAVVPVLVLLFVALWFTLRGNLFQVLPSVILLLRFSILLALRLPRLWKRGLILVLFVRLFNLRLFGFCLFPLLLGVWEGLRLVMWHSLDFSLTLFIRKEETDCFAFLWFAAYVLFSLVYVLFLLVLLVGHVQWLCLFLDKFLII